MIGHSQQSGVSKPLPILHLIETGGPGGAERVFLDLALHLHQGFCSMIGILKTGWLHSQVLSSGIPCFLIHSGGLGDLGVIMRLIQIVRKQRIRLIHAHELYRV